MKGTWARDGNGTGWCLIERDGFRLLGKLTKPSHNRQGWNITIPGLPKSWFNMPSQFDDVVFYEKYERAMSKVPYPLHVRSKAVAEGVILHVRKVMAEQGTDWFHQHVKRGE